MLFVLFLFCFYFYLRYTFARNVTWPSTENLCQKAATALHEGQVDEQLFNMIWLFMDIKAQLNDKNEVRNGEQESLHEIDDGEMRRQL